MRQAVLAALSEHGTKASAEVSMEIEPSLFEKEGDKDDHYLLHPL